MSYCLVRKLEIHEKSFKIPDLLFPLQEGRAHKLKCWKTLKPKSEPITWPVSYLLLIAVERQEILLNYKPPSNFWNMSAAFLDLFFALRQDQVDEDWMNNKIQMNTFFIRFFIQYRLFCDISPSSTSNGCQSFCPLRTFRLPRTDEILASGLDQTLWDEIRNVIQQLKC